MATILSSSGIFKLEAVPEGEYNIWVASRLPNILRFLGTLYFKYWRSYGNFKIRPTFRSRDLVMDFRLIKS